jgi:hypothetical protein
VGRGPAGPNYPAAIDAPHDDVALRLQRLLDAPIAPEDADPPSRDVPTVEHREVGPAPTDASHHANGEVLDQVEHLDLRVRTLADRVEAAAQAAASAQRELASLRLRLTAAEASLEALQTDRQAPAATSELVLDERFALLARTVEHYLDAPQRVDVVALEQRVASLEARSSASPPPERG